VFQVDACAGWLHTADSWGWSGLRPVCRGRVCRYVVLCLRHVERVEHACRLLPGAHVLAVSCPCMLVLSVLLPCRCARTR
jgi:hypothetical protein